MKIQINNETVDTPSDRMNIRDLVEWRGVKEAGTAIAVNNRLVVRGKWDVTYLSEGDNVTLITAAFGG